MNVIIILPPVFTTEQFQPQTIRKFRNRTYFFFLITGSATLGAAFGHRNAVAMEKEPVLFIQSEVRVVTALNKCKEGEKEEVVHTDDEENPKETEE